MNIVQQMLCRKQFTEWCKLRKIPASKYPEYGKRMFAIFQKAWMKSRVQPKTK